MNVGLYMGGWCACMHMYAHQHHAPTCSLFTHPHQVSSHGPSATAQQAATRMSDGKATLALELVGYDAEVAAAMKYAFGNAFVCKVCGGWMIVGRLGMLGGDGGMIGMTTAMCVCWDGRVCECVL